MVNLKKETLDILHAHGKSPVDIVWIGIPVDNLDGGDYKYGATPCEMPKDLFWQVADKEYDNGFDGHIIPLNLKIVGDDWWLERHEYDGSEWWEFKTLPTRPANISNPFLSSQNSFETWYSDGE